MGINGTSILTVTISALMLTRQEVKLAEPDTRSNFTGDKSWVIIPRK